MQVFRQLCPDLDPPAFFIEIVQEYDECYDALDDAADQVVREKHGIGQKQRDADSVRDAHAQKQGMYGHDAIFLRIVRRSNTLEGRIK